MVRRMMRLVYSEVRGLHQAAYILAGFTFASQALALVRDRLLAHQFGAGIQLDIYYTAFRVPDLLYVLFASTLSVYVLIPFVTERIKKGDTSEARYLLGQIGTFFLLIYILLAGLVWIFAPYIVPYLAPGLASHTVEIVIVLRILLLQPLFLGMSSLFGVVTQIGHHFVLYALSPLIYNLGIIFGIIVLYPTFGLSGLAYGVVLGACGHMAIQWPLIKQSNLSFQIVRTLSLRTIMSVLIVSVPRALTLALHQLVLIALVAIASLMTVGSVAIFQFAYNLQSVPLAVIGASYSIAAFPLLADLYVQEKYDQFRSHVISAMRHIIFWAVPIIALVIVLRAQLVRVVLGSGAFNWADTRLTAAVLALLCISLFAQAINLLVVRTFYAGGYTKIPFMITSACAAITVCITYGLFTMYQTSAAHFMWLLSLLRITDVSGGEVIVIALGYSFMMVIQTIIMLAVAHRLFLLPLRWLWLHAGRSLLAAVVGGIASYTALNFFIFGINPTSFLGIFIQGFLAGITGLLGVIVTYYIIGSPELREVSRALHGRLFKTKVVTVQDDIL